MISDLLVLEVTYLGLDPSGEVSFERVSLVDVMLTAQGVGLCVRIALSNSFASCSMVSIDHL